MKAVVKAKPEPGLWLEEVPVPEVGGDDVLIRVVESIHLRHGCADLQLGRLGAKSDSGPDDHWP